MAEHVQSIPGDLDCAHEALAKMLERKPAKLRAAVAFATVGGVDLLTESLGNWPGELEIVVRGAPITQPAALESLSDYGASVRAVVGKRAVGFHPKLWLSEGSSGVEVLSGSGNLTEGGMSRNDEQFELLRFDQKDARQVLAQRTRIETFLSLGVPIADLRGSRYWQRWSAIAAEANELQSKAEQLANELSEIAGTPAENAQLYADLLQIYEAAKAEVKILADDGSERPYVATRFKQAIDRGRREGTLVPVVSRIVNGPTEGFGRLAEAGRRDLMVETLVIDPNRLYHRLFTDKSKKAAQDNLALYDSEYRRSASSTSE